jgi:hypothetical protein
MAQEARYALCDRAEQPEPAHRAERPSEALHVRGLRPEPRRLRPRVRETDSRAPQAACRSRCEEFPKKGLPLALPELPCSGALGARDQPARSRRVANEGGSSACQMGERTVGAQPAYRARRPDALHWPEWVVSEQLVGKGRGDGTTCALYVTLQRGIERDETGRSGGTIQCEIKALAGNSATCLGFCFRLALMRVRLPPPPLSFCRELW